MPIRSNKPLQINDFIESIANFINFINSLIYSIDPFAYLIDMGKQEVILNTEDDWDLWIEQIQTFTNENFWLHIDPSDPDVPDEALPLLEMPQRPDIKKINVNAESYEQLTPAQQRVYENARRFYDQDLKQYQRQEDHQKELRKYIKDTVSDKKKLLLKPDLGIYDWLKKLKDSTEPSITTKRMRIHDQYTEALKGLKPGKVNQWLDRWETVMQLTEKYELPQTKNGIWLQDLAKAIRPLSDSLYTRYIQRAKNPKMHDISTFNKVLADVRDAIAETPKKSSTIARGSAFNAEFAGEPEEEKQTPNTGSGTNRKRAGTTSTEKNKPTKKSRRSKCPACEARGHTLANCWYIFKDKRPDDFEVTDERMIEIQKKIDEDKNLAARIEKLKLTEGDEA